MPSQITRPRDKNSAALLAQKVIPPRIRKRWTAIKTSWRTPLLLPIPLVFALEAVIAAIRRALSNCTLLTLQSREGRSLETHCVSVPFGSLFAFGYNNNTISFPPSDYSQKWSFPTDIRIFQKLREWRFRWKMHRLGIWDLSGELGKRGEEFSNVFLEQFSSRVRN